jgi:hypothetical protein
LEEEAIDRSVLRTCFGGDCGPVARQTTEEIIPKMNFASPQIFQKFPNVIASNVGSIFSGGEF